MVKNLIDFPKIFGEKFNCFSKDIGKDFNCFLKEWTGNAFDLQKIKDVVNALFDFQKKKKTDFVMNLIDILRIWSRFELMTNGLGKIFK